MSAYNNANTIVTPNGYKSGKIYALKPTDGSGDFSFTRATVATRRNSSGYLESVASGVPRLTYPTTGCPQWLLEKASTNIIQRNTAFDNAYWNKSNVTVVADAAVSPDGTSNADLVYPTSSGNSRTIDKSLTISSGVQYVTSVYLKAAGMSWYRHFAINAASGADAVWFNISTGAIGQHGASVEDYGIEDCGNGWYRVWVMTAELQHSG